MMPTLLVGITQGLFFNQNNGAIKKPSCIKFICFFGGERGGRPQFLTKWRKQSFIHGVCCIYNIRSLRECAARIRKSFQKKPCLDACPQFGGVGFYNVYNYIHNDKSFSHFLIHIIGSYIYMRGTIYDTKSFEFEYDNYIYIYESGGSSPLDPAWPRVFSQPNPPTTPIFVASEFYYSLTPQ